MSNVCDLASSSVSKIDDYGYFSVKLVLDDFDSSDVEGGWKATVVTPKKRGFGPGGGGGSDEFSSGTTSIAAISEYERKNSIEIDEHSLVEYD